MAIFAVSFFVFLLSNPFLLKQESYATVILSGLFQIRREVFQVLVFIDESGYPRPTDSTINPVLLGICMHELDIKPITNQIYKLKDSLYGKQDEIKSTKLVREATITKNRTINKAYTEGMINIATSYDTAVFAVIMDKPQRQVVVPEQHLPRQYYLLLKKVEFYCRRHHQGKAMMIFDEIHEEADRKIAEALTGFLFKTDLGRSFDHILEMPLFVSSAVTPSVRLADIFAGITRHYYEQNLVSHSPETEFQKWLKTLYDKLHSHTENNIVKSLDGQEYMEYGFQHTRFLDYHSKENSILTKSE